MNIEDFLKTLTADQLEELARLKREEDTPSKEEQPKKRKQNRNKVPTKKPTRNKKRNKKKKKRNTVQKLLDKQGVPAQRLGSTPLGDRPNRFVDGDLKDVSKSSLEDTKIDSLLNKDQSSSRHLMKRTQDLVGATCSRCEYYYDDISTKLCYKDGSIFVFNCDDCIRNS